MKGFSVAQYTINTGKNKAIDGQAIWRKHSRHNRPFSKTSSNMLIVQTPAANKKPLHANSLWSKKRSFYVSRQAVEARGNKLSAIYFQRRPGSEYLNSSIVMRFVAPASSKRCYGVVSTTTEQSLTPYKKTKGSPWPLHLSRVEKPRPVALSRNDSSPPVCPSLFLSLSPSPSFFPSLTPSPSFSHPPPFPLLSFRFLVAGPTFDRFLGAFSGNIKMPRRVVRTTISSVGAPDVPWIPGVRS